MQDPTLVLKCKAKITIYGIVPNCVITTTKKKKKKKKLQPSPQHARYSASAVLTQPGSIASSRATSPSQTRFCTRGPSSVLTNGAVLCLHEHQSKKHKSGKKRGKASLLDLAIRAELAVALGPGDGGVQQGAAAHLCGAAEEEAQQVDGRALEQADVAGQVGVAQAGREQVDDDAGAGGGREAGELARGVDLEQLAERVPAESQSRRCWVREARTGLPCCWCWPATGRRRCRRASLRRTARWSGRRSRRLSGAA